MRSSCSSRSEMRRRLNMTLRRATSAAFAVIGLGQVDELEVEAKRTRELVGSRKIEGADAVERLLEVSGSGGCIRGSALRSFGFAAGDGGTAKGFDGVVERVAGLLAENLAQKHAERADVAAKRSFLQFAGRGLQLGEAMRPVGWSP